MIQILVCNTKDISSIQYKGFGPDHVVEDFSVSFHLKRFESIILYHKKSALSFDFNFLLFLHTVSEIPKILKKGTYYVRGR